MTIKAATMTHQSKSKAMKAKSKGQKIQLESLASKNTIINVTKDTGTRGTTGTRTYYNCVILHTVDMYNMQSNFDVML
jgi:hypothetical protein